MEKTKFYICKHCGNIIAKVKDSGVPVVCCGEPMEELVANTVDAAKEKHLPVVSQSGNKVTVDVGSVAHPMTDEHFIEWVCLETSDGRQRKTLKPGKEPKAVFLLAEGEKPVCAYAYCNLHGLWKTDL